MSRIFPLFITNTYQQGDIYINGTPLSKTRKWFVLNTGYVRQLATSFYNELTVRENLLFSMNLQAPRGMSLEDKLERVEQVIKEVLSLVLTHVLGSISGGTQV